MLLVCSRADQLITVNECSLLDMSMEEVTDILSPLNLPPGGVSLKVTRPRNTEGLLKLLDMFESPKADNTAR